MLGSVAAESSISVHQPVHKIASGRMNEHVVSCVVRVGIAAHHPACRCVDMMGSLCRFIRLNLLPILFHGHIACHGHGLQIPVLPTDCC